MSTTATTRRTLNPIAIAALAAVAIVLPHVPSFFHRLLDFRSHSHCPTNDG